MTQVFWEAVVEVPEGMADDGGAALMLAGADGVQIIGVHEMQPTLPGSEAPRPQPTPGFATLVATYSEDIEPESMARDAVEALVEVGVNVAASAPASASNSSGISSGNKTGWPLTCDTIRKIASHGSRQS